jgi:hypothetical protein
MPDSSFYTCETVADAGEEALLEGARRFRRQNVSAEQKTELLCFGAV